MVGVPEDEIYLAKMLQSALSRGLEHTTGARYRDEAGRGSDNKDSAVSCCAVGAYALDEDNGVPYSNVACGNDNNGTVWTLAGDGADLGHTFKVAMTTEVEGD